MPATADQIFDRRRFINSAYSGKALAPIGQQPVAAFQPQQPTVFQPRSPLHAAPAPAAGPISPYAAQNPQNQGLAGAANSMHTLNQQIAARGPAPYQPEISPGQPAVSPYSPAMQQLVNRGLNDARFGNGRESMLYDISHPGNGVGSALAPRTASVEQAPAVNPAEFAKRQGLEFNPQTGVLAGNSQAAGMNSRQLGDLRSGVNPFAPRASTSQLAQNLKNTQEARKSKATSTPGQTPYQQRLAANEKASQTAFERAFAVNNPAEAAQMAGIKARQQIASDDRQSRESGLKQTLASQEKQVALRGGLDPNTGLPMTEPRGPLDAPNPSALAQLSPAELDVALKDYPQATRERLKEGVKQAQEPGFFSRLFGMSAMDPNVPADLYSPDHFLSRAAAAGVRTKPPVGLSKRAQELKQKNPSLFAPSAK